MDELLDVGARLRCHVDLQEARREARRVDAVNCPLADHQRPAVHHAHRRLLLQHLVLDGIDACDVAIVHRTREHRHEAVLLAVRLLALFHDL